MNRALVILCGGLSTRMGYNKAYLPFGDMPLLFYQIERFRPYFKKIYLSGTLSESEVRRVSEQYDVTVIPDDYDHIGPLGGLYSCLSATGEDILFFTSVDAPFTEVSAADMICADLEAHPECSISLIHDKDGKIQPMFAAYRKTCMPAIEKQIHAGNYKMKDLIFSQNYVESDRLFPELQFFNMNTPKDYYFALTVMAGQSPAQFPASFRGIQNPSDSVTPPVISFTAKSGTGKTTYLEKLLPLLKNQGIRIAILKHDAHGFEMDKPGKDSYRLSHAGADHMILTSADQTAAIIRHPQEPQDLHALITCIGPTDLILTEGYKFADLPQIPILRKGYCEQPIGTNIHPIAIVADFPYETELPLFDLNDPETIVPFLMDLIRK